MRYITSLFFAAALVAPAQIVSFGIKAGVPATQAAPYRFGDGIIASGRWTVGPTVEVRLVHNFSIEADALYHSYSTTKSSLFTDPNFGPMSEFIQAKTKVWDLPLLLKYRFLSGAWRPFVLGGYAVSYESNDVVSLLSCLTLIPAGSSLTSGSLCSGANTVYPDLGHPNMFGDSRFRRGPTAGAGIEYRFGKVKIAPEIRYTRIDNPNTNQASVIVGFTF